MPISVSIGKAATTDKVAAFFALQTKQDVATLLGVSYSQLTYYINRMPNSKKYTSFQIPKKNGNSRKIYTPCYPLKCIQSDLHNILQKIYHPRHPVHGFTLQRDIKTNAKPHYNKRWVLSIDIENFFPSIHYGRVRGLFMGIPFNFNKEVATVLAQICCHEKKLPQGAPTSPIISNMICYGLDNDLRSLAKQYHCVYTRYADDITFSSRSSQIPEKLLLVSESRDKVILGEEILKLFKKHSFVVNESKIHIKFRNQRQMVTGLVVNKKVNVSRKYIRIVRAMLHSIEVYGIDKSQEYFERKIHRYRHPRRPPTLLISHIRGKISFIGSVRGKNDTVYIKLLNRFRKIDPKWRSSLTLSDDQVREIEQLNKLLEVHKSNLDELQIQKAKHGIDVPVTTINSIRHEESQIKDINSKIELITSSIR